MRGVQGVGNLGQDVCGAGELEGALRLQDSRQIRAVHVPHGDEQNALSLVRVVDRDDVRVVDGRGGPGLPDEAFAERIVLVGT